MTWKGEGTVWENCQVLHRKYSSKPLAPTPMTIGATKWPKTLRPPIPLHQGPFWDIRLAFTSCFLRKCGSVLATTA